MKYYPIIIFCYNRPKHLFRLIESLKKNVNIYKHKFYIFCDGPKNIKDVIDIKKISKILNNFNCIKKKNIIFRKKNIGLSENIISGVSSILRKNAAAIVLEDDLQLGKSAINFINYHLNKYKDKKEYASISAYSYIHNLKDNENFYKFSLKRHCSWCWGTWGDRWKQVKWDKNFYLKNLENKSNKIKFNNLGNDMNLMLWGFTKNFLNSWSIRFNYHCMLNSLISIQPRYSMVVNNGSGKKGTNQRYSSNDKFDSLDKIKFNNFKKKIYFSTKIDNYIKNKHRPSVRLLFYYFISKIFYFLVLKNKF